MSWQASASRIKAVDPDGQAADVVLPVDSMTVYAEQYVPDGGTIQELVGGTRKFIPPTFGFIIELTYDFERTDFRPNAYDTLEDLLAVYMNTSTVEDSGLNFHVRYDPDTDSYINPSGNDYICPNMFPDIQGEDMPLEFSNRARQKNRELTLRSQSRNYTYDQVRWILD